MVVTALLQYMNMFCNCYIIFNSLFGPDSGLSIEFEVTFLLLGSCKYEFF